MAHLPEGQAQFEYTKMQLIGSLGAVAETMRNCATFAEQFAQLITPIQYPGAPLMFPNGQMPQMPPPQMEPTGGKRKVRGGDEEGEGKRKRKSKPKDPNAPKRPPSSYLLFQNEVRQELKTKHPNISNNELLAKISKAWSEMPKEQKDRYEARQALAKGRYEEQKKQYQKTLNDAAEPPTNAIDPTVIAGVSPPVASVVVTDTSEDENEEDKEEKDEDAHEESSGSEDSDEEEQQEQPPSKKSKQEAQPLVDGKKEKKKSKA